MRGISNTLNASTGLADEQYLQSIQLERRTDLGRVRRGIRSPRQTGDVQESFDNVNTFHSDSILSVPLTLRFNIVSVPLQ